MSVYFGDALLPIMSGGSVSPDAGLLGFAGQGTTSGGTVYHGKNYFASSAPNIYAAYCVDENKVYFLSANSFSTTISGTVYNDAGAMMGNGSGTVGGEYDSENEIYFKSVSGSIYTPFNPWTVCYLPSYSTSAQIKSNFRRFLNGENPDNPYPDNGTTTSGGGGGTGYAGLVNDDIDFPTLPSISASNAGFVSIWTPTLEQMQSMARWLWTTDLTKIAFWQKLITNPLDLIFGIYILPISIHHTDDVTTPTSDELVALNDRISLGWMDTGIGMDYVVEQYIEMDMGSIDVEECWGAFLDYEPYTKIDIYLPYIGVKSLDTNECMPKTVSLKYMIDIATGTCIALIKCDDSIYYHFVGNCASQIPITAVQMQEVVKGVMSIAVGAASFGIGGAMSAGAHASKAAITKGAAMQAAGAAMAGSGADSIAKGPRYPHSGTMAAAAGIMDVQTPYLIFSRPKQAIPEEQQKYTGYPSFITKELSELEGYTEVQIIHLHNMSCTTDEVNEIEQLLLSGVIF